MYDFKESLDGADLTLQLCSYVQSGLNKEGLISSLFFNVMRSRQTIVRLTEV